MTARCMTNSHFKGVQVIYRQAFKIIPNLVEQNTLTRFQIKRSKLYNLSITTPIGINSVINPVDITKKANHCLQNKEHN